MPAPLISNIATPILSSTSALINFRTSAASRSFVDYGTTTSYGSTTIDDPVRLYKEHAVVITGLTPNTLYHYRITALNGEGTTQGDDLTFTTASAGTTIPSLPTQIDTRMPDMTGAVERTVKASGGDFTPNRLQEALDEAANASGKRIITIDADLTMVGNFVLRNKVDSNWILVRTSAHASLPEGRRVGPAQSAAFFRLISPTVDPPLSTASAPAHHWRILGMEATVQSSAMSHIDVEQGGIVQIGVGAGQTIPNLPHHIVFDRCYVRGVENKSTRRGFYLQGSDLAIIDSYIDEFHSTGGDAQGILTVSVNRVKILNNTIISAGENFMWGGTGVLPGYVVGDIDYRHNYHTWHLKWKKRHPSYAGIDWVCKNLFEIKTSNRFFIFGNLFENWWFADQEFVINFKCEQNSAPGTTDLEQDVVFYKNFARNAGAGMTVVGNTVAGSVGVPQRVWVLHNLLEIDGDVWDNDNTGGNWSADAAHSGGVENCQFVHNTFVNSKPRPIVPDQTGGRLLLLGDLPPSGDKPGGFVWRDNIADHREFGVFASGVGIGTVALNAALDPGYDFSKNLIVGGNSAIYPPNNIFVSNWTNAKVVNFNEGVGGDYRLAADSPGKGAASDGTDIGCDVDAVSLATENTQSGFWSGSAPSAPTVVSVSPSSGPTTGGTTVSISGTGFATGALVTFGGNTATGIVVNSPTSITAVTPAHAQGSVSVVVTNTNGQAGTKTGGFTYTSPTPSPTVSMISPNSGSTAGGTGFTILGSGFQTGATVTLGGTPATGVVVSNATSILGLTPPHAAGAVDVVVQNPDGLSGTLVSGFTFVTPEPPPPPPATTRTVTVTSVDPASGAVIGMDPDLNGNGTGLTPFTRIHPDQSAVFLRANSPAAGNNFVKWRRDGVDVSTNRDITITLTADTTMTAVYQAPTPEPPPPVPTFTLTLTSVNPGSGVPFLISPLDKNSQGNGSTPLTRTYDQGIAVAVTAPVTVAGNTFKHWLKNGIVVSTALGITVTMDANHNIQAVYETVPTPPPSSPAPTITSVLPSKGGLAGGTSVVIVGTGFQTGATVTFGGVAATSVNVVNAISIRCVTPARATAGKVNVVVTNPDMKSATRVGGFQYQKTGGPKNSSVSPNGGLIIL